LISKLPDELQNLTGLQYLWIGENKLTELPLWLGKLTNLREHDFDTPLAVSATSSQAAKPKPIMGMIKRFFGFHK
jgi:Leucine-rich repeat (LRR) protein